MHKQDDSQQSAELRQAFLRHLPRRIETLTRRGQRQAREGWDINALSVIFREVQTLAGACGRYGLLDMGERLYAIENFLSGFVEQIAIPDPAQTDTFARLMSDLTELNAANESSAANAATLAAAEAARIDRTENGYPLALAPPAEYWLRFGPAVPLPAPPAPPEPAAVPAPEPVAPLAVAPAAAAADAGVPVAPPAAAAAAAAPEPRAAPVARAAAAAAAPRKVYHVSDGNPLACEIDQKLEIAGYELALLDSVEELQEMIGALPPHLIVVDSPFLADLDVVADLLRSARGRVSHRVAMLALSENGDLAVRLRTMRAGADAFVTLPAQSGDVLARIQELTEAEASDPFRVLIVEDDRSQAIFAESILRKAGMLTMMVTDPLAALDTLERFKPDLILMDLYMPGCDGMELTAIIRERDAFVSTPIVFLSGEHDTDKHFEALNAGGDDFLSKPIRPKHLISAVTNRLRRARHLHRRTQNANPRDPVSGLYDRAFVLDRINAKLADDNASAAGGLVCAEIDGAAQLREKLGLIAFESLFVQVGTFLAGHVGAAEQVTRLGEATFLLLSPDLGTDELKRHAVALRERLLRETFDAGGQRIKITLSLGLCPFDAALGDAGAMLNAAETALREGRKPGGGNVGVFKIATGNAALVESIQDALRADAFHLLFQPIASLQGEEEEQFQALLRLRGDDGKLHTAAEIVPAAERAGLADELDRWVLGRCLMVLAERSKQGRMARIFVSQSASAARDPGRIAWVRQQLEARRLGGERVALEFRVPDDIGDAELAELARFALELKQLGVTVAVAGVETSAAMLRVLENVPADFAKLAGRYVTDRTPEAREELRRVVNRAHERGQRIIATRIEDAQSAAQLWTVGVDFIQGNFVQQADQDLSYDFRATAS